MEQQLIAVDQFLNTLVWAKGEGFGMADETLSARAWRLRDRSATWGRFQRGLDAAAGTVFRQPNHCRAAYESELLRRQMPAEYQQPAAA